MRLLFVRHGQTDWNKQRKVQGHADIPLNEYGIYLAEKTCEGLKDEHIDLCYTSPLVRAKKTAEVVLGDRDIPIYDEEAIMEISFGEYEGVCIAGEHLEGDALKFNKFFSDTGAYIPAKDGESIEHLMDRVDAFLHNLYEDKELKDKTILISTHGAALKAMMNCIKGIQDTALFWNGGVSKNCAVAEVIVENGEPKITYENKVFY